VPDATAPLNTYWVVPGKFLAGEYPGDKDLVKAREKINRFLEVGVRHFVDLTELCQLEGLCMCTAGAEWVEPGLWSRAGCKSTVALPKSQKSSRRRELGTTDVSCPVLM
jgi:hypothetical protein